MIFAHDTELALRTAAALLNTTANGHDTLSDPPALERFFASRRDSGLWAGTPDELREVVDLRSRLGEVWRATDTETKVGLVNALLSSSKLEPQLTNHDGEGWHLHAASGKAPVAQRMRAELALALADLIRANGADRLRLCEAPGCDAVLVDLSRNRSRRYCDTGNCGNRQHVAAYRARQAARLSVLSPPARPSRPGQQWEHTKL